MGQIAVRLIARDAVILSIYEQGLMWLLPTDLFLVFSVAIIMQIQARNFPTSQAGQLFCKPRALVVLDVQVDRLRLRMSNAHSFWRFRLVKQSDRPVLSNRMTSLAKA